MTVSRRWTTILAGVAVIAATGLTWPAAAQAQTGKGVAPHAETFGSRGPLAPAGQAKPAIQPPSVQRDLALRNQPVVQLDGVDADALLAEDEAAAQFRQPTRVGVLRDVLVRANDGQWHDVEGGRLWTTDLLSTEAIGVRLKFIGMDLPDGAELYAYAPADPQRVDGPLTGTGRYQHGEMWSKTFWGERVRIEYFVPDGVADGDDEVPFVVSNLSHWYRPLHEDGRGAGGCHNDVTCFPGWQDVADAVGLITFIDGGQFVCTGQLLDTEVGDLTPWFYTANHCIDNQTIAETSEIFWFFQTGVCNGSASPGISTVNIDHVISNTTIDYALLMINGALPANLYWVGWTTSVPPSGTDSTAVHHPAGSWKRISFGQRLTGSVCGFGGSANYHRVSWDLPDGGVVEGGSSGSGIYRNDTQQIYGALFCGQSSNPCAQPSLDDDYGRFDRFYVVGGVENVLEEGPDDNFEPNDTCAEATPLSPGNFSALVVKSTQEDWYAFDLNQSDELIINCSFIHADGDIDLELRDGCDGSVVASGTTSSNNEAVSFTNTSGPGTFYLRVFIGGTDTRAEYSLSATVSLANDTCGTGVPITTGSNPFTTVGASTEGPAVPGACGFDDDQIESDIWFAFTPPCADDVTISICDADFQPRLAVYFISCPTGPNNPEPVACDEGGCPGGAEVTFAASAGFTYQVRVGGANGATGSGTIEVVCGAPPSCPADIAEGDDVVNVFDLLELLANWGADGPGADLDEPNDVVDVFDLLALLSEWGPC